MHTYQHQHGGFSLTLHSFRLKALHPWLRVPHRRAASAPLEGAQLYTKTVHHLHGSGEALSFYSWACKAVQNPHPLHKSLVFISHPQILDLPPMSLKDVLSSSASPHCVPLEPSLNGACPTRTSFAFWSSLKFDKPPFSAAYFYLIHKVKCLTKFSMSLLHSYLHQLNLQCQKMKAFSISLHCLELA